jgi:hypothetical protein
MFFCPRQDSIWARRSSRFISSLTGRNLGATPGSYSFVPTGLHRRARQIPGLKPEVTRIRHLRCRPEMHGASAAAQRAAGLRANLPATHIRLLRSRPVDAGDFGDTGCIRGAVYANGVRGPSTMSTMSTMSTVSTVSTRGRECRRDACVTRKSIPGRRSAVFGDRVACHLRGRHTVVVYSPGQGEPLRMRERRKDGA